MMVPTIHLNGTKKEWLEDQVYRAVMALQAAETAMSEASPNGRDYYVQGPSAIGAAISEHVERMAKIAKVREEMTALYEAIAEGGFRRR